MPALSPNKVIRSEKPDLLVENPFEPGIYRFSLVVLDDSDNASIPTEIVVHVREKTIAPRDPSIFVRPDRIIRPIDTGPIGETILRPIRPGRPIG
jgi:hypothetical protein